MICKIIISLSLIVTLGFAEGAHGEDAQYYLFPKPIQIQTQIGSVGQTLIYGIPIALTLVAIAGFWATMHSKFLSAAYAAYAFLTLGRDIGGYSFFDLQARKWLRMDKVARDLSAKPGIESVWVLSSGQDFQKGILFFKNLRTGFVLVKAEPHSLALEELKTRLGEPLTIRELQSFRVTLRLKIDGKDEGSDPISMTLADLARGQSLDPNIGNQWRNIAQNTSTDSLGISAVIEDVSSGTKIELDRFLEGYCVKSILGLTRLTKLVYLVQKPFSKAASRIGSLSVTSRVQNCGTFMEELVKPFAFGGPFY